MRRAVMPGPAENVGRYYYDYLRSCIEKERKEKRRCRDGNESTGTSQPTGSWKRDEEKEEEKRRSDWDGMG